MEYKPAEILDEILNYTRLNCNQLSEKLGINPQTFYDIRSSKKRKKISNTVADKICKVYPEINKLYLISGSGSLLLDIKAATFTDGRVYDILEKVTNSLLISAENNREREKINLIYAESFERISKSLEIITEKLISK